MDLKVLEIASHTENNKILDNFTHKSKNKNPLCGDEMEISLIVKNNVIKEMGYQCKSCIYCQASVSLLSRKVIQLSMAQIRDLLSSAENFFRNNENINIKRWKVFKEIMNKDNISRKECLLLPFRTLSKALDK